MNPNRIPLKKHTNGNYVSADLRYIAVPHRKPSTRNPNGTVSDGWKIKDSYTQATWVAATLKQAEQWAYVKAYPNNHILQQLFNDVAELGYETDLVTPLAANYSKHTPETVTYLEVSAITQQGPYKGGYRTRMHATNPKKDNTDSFISTIDFQTQTTQETLKLIETLTSSN